MFRFLKRFFMIFACLLVVIFAIFLVDSVEVFADVVLTTVDLTVEQTLALYGTSIPATYYNGSTWSACEFSYFQSSLEVIDALSSVPSGTKTVIANDWDWRSYPTGFASTDDYIDSMIVGLPRLYYRCPASSVPGISNGSLQFSLTPSIDISNIAYFRQNLNMSVTGTSSFSDYPYNSEFTVASSFSYSDAPVVSYGLGWDGKAYNRFKTPILQDFGGGRETWFSTVDIFGYHVDENGNDSVFSVGNQVFSLSHCAPVTLDNVDYYIIAVSCPRLSADYVLPNVPTPTPDLSSQLDTLIDVNTQSNTTLQQILAKLDLIYQAMQREEQTPTLQDPERIGFDSRTKEEILQGVRNGDSILDSANPSQVVNQDVFSSFWDFWGRLTDDIPIFPVYFFVMVCGLVGWILYGKRGG